jgi:long-subunit fatty acid transport protein
VYRGKNQFYATAPAELTSESTSPLIFFSEVITENVDSFFIESPQVLAVNLSIDMRYQLSKKLAAGFSIDAIGISFGADKTGTHINGAPTGNENAKPTPFNILLISDNDIGSLNSEIYLAYDVSDKVAVKAGTQFLFTEYTTDSKVQTEPEENDRFRRKSFLFAIGVVLKL